MFGEIAKHDYLYNDKGAAALADQLGTNLEALRATGGAVPLEQVQELKKRCGADGRVFGFKAFYYHVDASPWLPEFALDSNTRVIHLYRDRPFETFTSRKLAQATGSWLNAEYPEARLEFSESEYLQFRDQARSQYQEWRRLLWLGKPTSAFIEMEYSSIGSRDALDAAAEFLRLDDLKLPKMKKQRTRPVTEYWADPNVIAPWLHDRLASEG
jgi:hypothetical protein